MDFKTAVNRSSKGLGQTIVVRSGYNLRSGAQNFLSTVIDRAYRGEPIGPLTMPSAPRPTLRIFARQLQPMAAGDCRAHITCVNAGEGASFAEFRAPRHAHGRLDVNLVQDISSTP